MKVSFVKQLKIITFITVLFLSAKCFSGDSTKLSFYNGDTLLYFKKVFEENKSLYVNNVFDSMLKKMEVPPMFFFSDIKVKDINSVNSISIFFIEQSKYDSITVLGLPQKVIKLKVSFLGILPNSDSTNLIAKNSEGSWSRMTKNYFKKYIVKDFSFYKY